MPKALDVVDIKELENTVAGLKAVISQLVERVTQSENPAPPAAKITPPLTPESK